MHDKQSEPWIHLGECPFCQGGLRRIRVCQSGTPAQHLFAMCDECEALWTAPDLDAAMSFPNLDAPQCPICAASLYGPGTGWATLEEIVGTPWAAAVQIDDPADDEGGVEGGAPENLAAGPPKKPLVSQGDSDPDADLTYGQDDPKPGC
ncbi:hypothetical protein [Aureliella helgolandensis]|uniref:Uncharacterized protein n=1 Tax=Aureliella helgolandensis TaxID=2527968 RepID=A0A518GFQ0_9BACT|nr:hypothetical protein [Aureliella helgolandensis]QDV27423.1 hypothetical protein Q31a_58120 [Aureliella helgolandensis]